MTTPVYLEGGERRVFACALDWPGWCRSGKDEQRALEALGASAPRYAVVAGEAGLDFPPGADFRFEVVERVEGSGATDFGIPDKLASTDHDPAGPEEVSRARALVAAAWAVFDRVVAGAPVELRKGPRGGGRDRDAIVEHVLAAEVGYARQLGLRLRQPDGRDQAAWRSNRSSILGALDGGAGRRWPLRYAARRVAWHVLDHAWEIEDRTPA